MIVRWINDGCAEIVTNNYTNQGTYKGQTIIEAGKSEYALPPDLYLLRAVRVNGIKITHTTYEQLNAQDDSAESAVGAPSHYWVYDNLLHLYPTPDTALGSVDIYYVKSPDLITVDMLEREPDVPKQYHLRLVEYCIAQAAELDDNISQYQLKMGQFKDNLQSLKQNGEQPENDGYYPFITYTGEYEYVGEVW